MQDTRPHRLPPVGRSGVVKFSPGNFWRELTAELVDQSFLLGQDGREKQVNKSGQVCFLLRISKMDMEIQPVPWWNRRSRMERRFIWLIASLLLVSVGLAVGLVGIVYKQDIFVTEDQVQRHVVSPALHHELDPR